MCSTLIHYTFAGKVALFYDTSLSFATIILNSVSGKNDTSDHYKNLLLHLLTGGGGEGPTTSLLHLNL